MPRRKRAAKRFILPDPLFDSSLIAKFINAVMCDGKKSLAENIVYGALDKVVQKVQSGEKKVETKFEGDANNSKKNSSTVLSASSNNIRSDKAAREAALNVFKEALDKVTPSVEVKSRPVGGSTYQVPVEIPRARGVALAMRWLIENARQRKDGKTMRERLYKEIMDALENRGGAVRKREDTHRMAKANQAFAHYSW